MNRIAYSLDRLTKSHYNVDNAYAYTDRRRHGYGYDTAEILIILFGDL